MPTVEILKSDDVTPATKIAISASAGSESAQTELHVWYSKGTAGGTAKNLRLVIAAESKTSPGTLVYSGVPCLDRGWLKVRVSGTVNPDSVAGLIPQSTGWYPVSSGLPLTLFDLPGNTARKVFVKLATPIDVGQVSEEWTLYLVPTWEDVVTPMPLGLRAIGCGILSGVGDLFVTESVEAATIEPSGTPDDYVHATGVSFIVAGVEAILASADFQLNQNDRNGDALASGESYIAALLVSWDGAAWIGATLKGTKATAGSAEPPALTSGGLLGYVEVAYGASGSVIEAGAITNLTLDRQFKVTAGTGRTVTVGPGRALLPGVFVERRDTVTVTLTSSPRWLWLATDGTIEQTGSAVPKYAGALALAKVESSVGIDAIEDLRSVVRSPFNSTPFTLPGNVAIVDDVNFNGHAIVNATGVLVNADGIDIALGGHTVSGGLLSGMTLADGLDADGKTITDPVLSGASLGGALDANGSAVVNLPVAAEGADADAVNVGFTYRRGLKLACSLVSLVDVPTLEGELTIDGEATFDGDRVLLTAQATASDNGIWIVRTGAWERAPDVDMPDYVAPGALTYIVGGASGGKYFLLTATDTWAKLTTDANVNGRDIDLNTHTLSNGNLSSMTLSNALNANGQAIEGLPTLGIVADHGNAANMRFVLARPAKTWARLCSTAHVAWPDLALNGGFDADLSNWTAGAGWAWDGVGAALHTAGNTESLSQTFDLIEGVRYRTSYAISGTVGTVQIYLGAVAGTARAFDYGACEEYIIAAATETVAVQLVPSSDFDGTIDNFYIEPTFYGTPSDPDIDGVTIADTDCVLLTAQDDGTQNGKWIASLTGAWTRYPDCAAAYYLPTGTFLYVKAGTANGHKVWMMTSEVNDFATDAQTWELWATIGGA